MPDSIKKVLLKKQINNVMYSIFPKTSADIVDYTKSVVVDETPTETTTTVAAELLSHATLIADRDTSATVNSKITTAIDNLRKELLGVDNEHTAESINRAYDTLREIATFIEEHENNTEGVASYFNRIATLETKVGNEAVAGVGNVGDVDYVAPVAATGLIADTRDLQSRVAALEDVGSTKVEDGDVNGYIKIDDVDVEVYDDSDLRTRLGYASKPAVGTEGQEGYQAPVAASGLFARVETLEADLDALETYVGTATTTSGDPAVTVAGTGLTKRIEDIEGAAVYSVSKSPSDVADGTIRVVTGTGTKAVTTDIVAYTGDPTVVDQDTTHRFVTDAQITTWTNLVSSVTNVPAEPDPSILYMVDITA